jgi:hypothetical protein
MTDDAKAFARERGLTEDIEYVYGPRPINTTAEALEFAQGVVASLELEPEDADAVMAVMLQFAMRLRPDLGITTGPGGSITIDTNEARA